MNNSRDYEPYVNAESVEPEHIITPRQVFSISGVLMMIPLLLFAGWFAYWMCIVEVPSKHMAVLIKKTGQDLPNDMELAPDEEQAPVGTYKGIQQTILTEGRYFYNPYHWDWIVEPQVQIPEGKAGIRVRLYGDELPPGEMIAWQENQKGVIPGYLRPGSRHQLNAWIVGSGKRRRNSYAEYIQLVDPVIVPSGHIGIVTELSAPMPEKPNQLLSEPNSDGKSSRGVQIETKGPGTYWVNPYMTEINLVNTRKQKFTLSDVEGMLGFPTKDGFWVTLDSKIEYRIKESEAAKVFVTYNEIGNDTPGNRPIDEEIINKIILPNTRSFARLKGSGHSGRELISGDTRIEFQNEFQKALQETCGEQGIEIVEAVITDINPPQKIAGPVRDRQIAVQKEHQYEKQIEQQQSEQELAIEQAMVKQKQAVVVAEQAVVMVVTEAKKKQEVALIEAAKRLAVSEQKLMAAKDEAAATLALGKADADVIKFQNEAEAAGWAKAVEAFGYDGSEYARWTMLKKLAPAYRKMMVNTADSPVMDIFDAVNDKPTAGDAGAARPRPNSNSVEETEAQVEAFLKKVELIESEVPTPVIEELIKSDDETESTTDQSPADKTTEPTDTLDANDATAADQSPTEEKPVKPEPATDAPTAPTAP